VVANKRVFGVRAPCIRDTPTLNAMVTVPVGVSSRNETTYHRPCHLGADSPKATYALPLRRGR
jgi:hypothetical protein